jgi:hypothetical protein
VSSTIHRSVSVENERTNRAGSTVHDCCNDLDNHASVRSSLKHLGQRAGFKGSLHSSDIDTGICFILINESSGTNQTVGFRPTYTQLYALRWVSRCGWNQERRHCRYDTSYFEFTWSIEYRRQNNDGCCCDDYFDQILLRFVLLVSFTTREVQVTFALKNPEESDIWGNPPKLNY